MRPEGIDLTYEGITTVFGAALCQEQEQEGIDLTYEGITTFVVCITYGQQQKELRNPFFLDRQSGSDWTLNPVSTGQ